MAKFSETEINNPRFGGPKRGLFCISGELEGLVIGAFHLCVLRGAADENAHVSGLVEAEGRWIGWRRNGNEVGSVDVL